MTSAADDKQVDIFGCVEDVFFGTSSVCTQQVYHTAASNFDSSSLVVLGVTDEHIFFKVNAYPNEGRKRDSRFPLFFSAPVGEFARCAFERSPFELAKSPGYTISDLTECYTKPWNPWEVEQCVKDLPRLYEKAMLPSPSAAHGKGDTLAVVWDGFCMALTADGRVLFATSLPSTSRTLLRQIRVGVGFLVLGIEHVGATCTNPTPSVIVFPFSNEQSDLAEQKAQPINLNPGDELLCFEVCDVWNDTPGVSSIYIFFRREGKVQMREVHYDNNENKVQITEECTHYDSLPFFPLAARITEDGQVLCVLDTKMRLWLFSHEGITPPFQLIVGGDQTPFFKDFRVLHEFSPYPPKQQTDETGMVILKAVYSKVYVILALNTGVVRYRSLIRYDEKVVNFNRVLDDHLSDIPEDITFIEQACYNSAHLVNSIAVSHNWMCFALETQQVVCVTPVSPAHSLEETEADSSSSSSSSWASSSFSSSLH